MHTEWSQKKDIIEIGRRLWQKQFVAANDGNITVKLNDNELLATATGVSKGFMTADMIVKIDQLGKPLSPSAKYKPSSEISMHIEIYRKRPDVGAVVHAHPVFCTAFAVAGLPLDQCVLPEAIVSLGAVPLAAYALPSTLEVPQSISPFLETSNAILLQNHGALTFGKDLFDAYYRMETLEHTARIIWNARQLGNVNILSQNERDRLLELREKYGFSTKTEVCTANNNPATEQSPKKDKPVTEDIIREITKKVIERLK